MRYRRATLWLIAGIFASWYLAILGADHGYAAGQYSARIGEYVVMESTGPVYDVLYRYGHNDAAADGAYGPNRTARSASWFLEYQRAGGYDITAGVVRHDVRLIAEGLRILHFGLARESRDGSFPGSYSAFHGTAMFLSEAAPGLIMLRASPYASQFAAEISWQIGQMQRAARHLPTVVEGVGRLDDATKTHRQFEAAMAFGAVGVLQKDTMLVRWSRMYAWHGVSMTGVQGIMPENGGHDSGYQALGMVNATRYLDLIARGKLARALRSALQRGETWEMTRIRSDGSINQSGDTRTAECREHDLVGKCKTVFYAPIFSALAHWARVSGDQRFASAAFRVWQRSGYGG